MPAFERGAALSVVLWNLVRPIAIRKEGEITTSLFGVMAHPIEDKAVMFVPDDYVVLIHEDANINEFVALFPHLSLSARVELSNYLSANSSVDFESLAFLFGTQLTDEEMEEYYQ